MKKFGTIVKKKGKALHIKDKLTNEEGTYYALKGDSTRFIKRNRKPGQRGRNYLVEFWAYRTIVKIELPKLDLIIPKNSLFIWSGVRNRYEWKSEDGMLQGMSKEQMDADKRFKKVRLPKKYREQVEWSKPKPTNFAELGQAASIAFANTQRILKEQKLVFPQGRAYCEWCGTNDERDHTKCHDYEADIEHFKKFKKDDLSNKTKSLSKVQQNNTG